MRAWYREQWRFIIEVLKVGEDNDSRHCRLGYEPGDIFICAYETPKDFCPKSLLKMFPLMEAVRSGGDLRQLGGFSGCQMDVDCPDGVVCFRLTGEKVDT